MIPRTTETHSPLFICPIMSLPKPWFVGRLGAELDTSNWYLLEVNHLLSKMWMIMG